MAEKIAMDEYLFSDMEDYLTQDFDYLNQLKENRDAVDAAFEEVCVESPVLGSMKSLLDKMVNLVNDYYLLNQEVINNYLKVGRQLKEQDGVIYLSLTAMQSTATSDKWEIFHQAADLKDPVGNVYRAAGYDI